MSSSSSLVVYRSPSVRNGGRSNRVVDDNLGAVVDDAVPRSSLDSSLLLSERAFLRLYSFMDDCELCVSEKDVVSSTDNLLET